MKTFNGYTFAQLFDAATLAEFDAQFLASLSPKLKQQLLAYRLQPADFSAIDTSELLLNCAPMLEKFIIELFDIANEVQALRFALEQNEPIWYFKKWFVLRRAKRRLSKQEPLIAFAELDAWLNLQLEQFKPNFSDKELAIAQLAQHYLHHKEEYTDAIERLTQWCIHVLRQKTKPDWSSFKLPQYVDHQHLVALEKSPKMPYCFYAPKNKSRQGFDLTDLRMSLREVQDEINYCLFCHEHDGDSCAKGLWQKTEPQLKTDALGNILTGCPLGEKISEMQILKRDGYNLAALAMLMVDNPMCPATGHRICNECMKACVYQKQNPVNIPQIETKILTDVLNLPYGVEIYDLFTRWNPLRSRQFLPKAYNGLKILIVGQGPAGFTLAHHLLMEGYAVVGVDGLKIEPLADELLQNPIKDWHKLQENLSQRITLGFGGVIEYGITSRWDKNFLKLIYISLLRRNYYQIFGNVRFGGNITVQDAWELGFDHLAIAVGAGLPQALPIENSLATGMRQANDFLMSLQLTGAAKTDSLASLQIRLPAVVIGGGLTAIDAATEVQAYYLVQIEKIASRYAILQQAGLDNQIWQQLTEYEANILREFLYHAEQLQQLKQQAKINNTSADLLSLIHNWGGVTIVYRRKLEQSPAYIRNHEEVIQAMQEGLYYAPGFTPLALELDEQGYTKGLICAPNSEIQPNLSANIIFPAKTVLVATGAKTNIAYEFEHRGTFTRSGFEYQPYNFLNGELQPAKATIHCKQDNFGAFTSYQQQDYKISFLGDAHPTFHGNVVKAIASGQKVYPHIVQALANKTCPATDLITEYAEFKHKIQDLFTAKIKSICAVSTNILILHIRAPMAARKFAPGQFFRLQNFETNAHKLQDTKLYMEAIALLGAAVDEHKTEIKLIVITKGASSRLCHHLQVGQKVALMGPTGVRAKISTDEHILFIGGGLAVPELLAVGTALRQNNNKITYIALFKHSEEVFCHSELLTATDKIIWNVSSGQAVIPQRPQDISVNSDLATILQNYDTNNLSRVIVIGDAKLINLMQNLAAQTNIFPTETKFFASTFSSMQCMLKGVCAQCLQWQIDPQTKQRTKAVFACSWQEQPMQWIDTDNLHARLRQNKVCEVLNSVWLDYLELST